VVGVREQRWVMGSETFTNMDVGEERTWTYSQRVSEAITHLCSLRLIDNYEI